MLKVLIKILKGNYLVVTINNVNSLQDTARPHNIVKIINAVRECSLMTSRKERAGECSEMVLFGCTRCTLSRLWQYWIKYWT